MKTETNFANQETASKKTWQQPLLEIISKNEIEHQPGSTGGDGGTDANTNAS